MPRKEPGFKKIKVFPKSVMRLVAVKHIPVFKKRVKRGIDGDGVVFDAYTPEYQQYKASGFKSQKHKRNRKGQLKSIGKIKSMKGKSISSKRIHPPDLTVTGDMMRNLKRKKQGKDFYTIGFTGEEAAKVDYNRRMGRDITNDIPNQEKGFVTKLLAKEMDKHFKMKLKDVTITVGS
jgi:hypothetical protein